MYRLIRKIHDIYLRREKRFIRWYYTRRVREHVGECGPRLAVNGRSVVGGGAAVRFGDNINFNGIRIAGKGGVTIGDNFHSGKDVRIFTVNHDYDHGSAVPYGKEVVLRPVTIGDNVWLGDSVTVLPGAVIGEGAVIGAGAVVSGEIPPLAVAAGNPAVVKKYRDRAHYEELKAQGKFV